MRAALWLAGFLGTEMVATGGLFWFAFPLLRHAPLGLIQTADLVHERFGRALALLVYGAGLPVLLVLRPAIRLWRSNR